MILKTQIFLLFLQVLRAGSLQFLATCIIIFTTLYPDLRFHDPSGKMYRIRNPDAYTHHTLYNTYANITPIFYIIRVDRDQLQKEKKREKKTERQS